MEAKDIFESLGLDPVDSKEKFLESFKAKYFTKEQATDTLLKEMVGKKFTKAKQAILNKAREEDIEFTQSEFEDKPIEDVAYEIASRKASKYEAKLKELEAKAGQSGEEVVKEWKEKYEKATKRASDEEQLRKTLAGEFEGYKTQAATAQKGIKLDYFKTELLKKTRDKFKPKVSDLELEGFESRISKSYKFDFDDQGNPFATDATGNRIRSAEKADQFMTPDDILLSEAKKLNLLPETPNAGKPVGTFTPPVHPFTPGQQPAPGQPAQIRQPGERRKINPMFDNM